MSRRRRATRTAPLQALIIDSWYDSYVGVVSLVRVMNGSLKTGQKIRVWTTGRAHQVDKLGRFTPKSLVADALYTGEVGFVIAGVKEIDGAPVGDTITLDNRPCDGPLPGFKADQAARVRRAVPGQFRRLRGVPRRAAEVEAERLRAALRAGGVDRARLRLSLRVPRPAAHGHRAGAPRARIRTFAGHQRAHRGLRGAHDRRRDRQRRQSREAAAGRPDRRAARADHRRQHPAAAGLRRAGDEAVPREARRAEEAAVPRQPGVDAVRAAARGSRARLLRPAEERAAAATHRSTTSSPASRPRRWCGSTS